MNTSKQSKDNLSDIIENQSLFSEITKDPVAMEDFLDKCSKALKNRLEYLAKNKKLKSANQDNMIEKFILDTAKDRGLKELETFLKKSFEDIKKNLGNFKDTRTKEKNLFERYIYFLKKFKSKLGELLQEKIKKSLISDVSSTTERILKSPISEDMTSFLLSLIKKLDIISQKISISLNLPFDNVYDEAIEAFMERMYLLRIPKELIGLMEVLKKDRNARLETVTSPIKIKAFVMLNSYLLADAFGKDFNEPLMLDIIESSINSIDGRIPRKKEKSEKWPSSFSYISWKEDYNNAFKKNIRSGYKRR